MKTGIHPNYYEIQVNCSCGNAFAMTEGMVHKIFRQFAFEQFNIVPDILTIAKAFGGGLPEREQAFGDG